MFMITVYIESFTIKMTQGTHVNIICPKYVIKLVKLV